MRKPTYTLDEIANWSQNNFVSLPKVQRGFVWKPSQIENLWDSLLRGYPIGAFVMSPSENKNKGYNYEMLDGQQRHTAICLGFAKKTLRDNVNEVSVFIDLEKPKGNDNRKYIFRVITKSHPWGYQRTDNTKTLSSENIRKARKLYGVDNHLEVPFDERFFPFDATLPVPFHLFIEAAASFNDNESLVQLISKIYALPYWNKVTEILSEKVKQASSDIPKTPHAKKKIPELSSGDKISTRITEIYETLKKILDKDDGQKVPTLYLDFEQFKKEAILSIPDHLEQDHEKKQIITDESEDEDGQAEAEDEIENLFIRLNAGGTPLRGEDLNYSILKAKIEQKLQDKIEKACQSFMSPARFITIAYRLYHHKQTLDVGRDSLSMKVKAKQFQRTIHDDLRKAEATQVNRYNFETFLEEVCTNNTYENSTLLEYAKYILSYSKINLCGLPYLITSEIADAAPEVMFMLLYRLLIKGDRFKLDAEDASDHKRMIGVITMFMWFGRGKKGRDHSKLLSNIWPAIKDLEGEKLFWSASTIQRARINDVLASFPQYYELSKILKENISHGSGKTVRDRFNKTDFGFFLNQILDNRNLILYAQRDFLSTKYKEDDFNLQDTNVPFDWDHIYPSNLIYKPRKIPKIIKECRNTNGNLRAWPYDLNRMDQDDLPSIKLDPLNPKKYLNTDKEQLSFQNAKNNWQSYIKEKNIETHSKLKDHLMKISACSNEWGDCSTVDTKGDWRTWKPVYKLIMERNLSICQTWYTELLIKDLISIKDKWHFAKMLNKQNGNWKKNPVENPVFKKAFNHDDDDFWVSREIFLSDSCVQIYFTYCKDSIETLGTEEIGFGLYLKKPGTLLQKIESTDKDKKIYTAEEGCWIYNAFTLISHDEELYIKLFSQFKTWFKAFTNNEMKSLAEEFDGLLIAKYKSK